MQPPLLVLLMSRPPPSPHTPTPTERARCSAIGHRGSGVQGLAGGRERRARRAGRAQERRPPSRPFRALARTNQIPHLIRFSSAPGQMITAHHTKEGRARTAAPSRCNPRPCCSLAVEEEARPRSSPCPATSRVATTAGLRRTARRRKRASDAQLSQRPSEEVAQQTQ